MGIFKRRAGESSDVMEFKDFEPQAIQALTSGNKAEATRLLGGKVRCPKCVKIVQPDVGSMGPQQDLVIMCSRCNQVWTVIGLR